MQARHPRFVIPVDGGRGDERVLALVNQMAVHQSVSITMLYVVEVPQSMPLDAELPEEIAHGDTVLRAAEVRAKTVAGKGNEVITELLQARAAGAAIVDEAIDRHADMIVMSATNRRQHGRTTVGETVEYVMRNAPCEVLIARLATDDAGDGDGRWR